MHFDAIILAATGVILLGVAASGALNALPRAQQLEPAVVGLSLVMMFAAVFSSITEGAEKDPETRLKALFDRYQFVRHCEQRLGGLASLSENQALCDRDGFIADNHAWADAAP